MPFAFILSLSLCVCVCTRVLRVRVSQQARDFQKQEENIGTDKTRKDNVTLRRSSEFKLRVNHCLGDKLLASFQAAPF